MKKFLSLILTALMLASLVVACIPASAADARDPQITADKSMLIDVPQQADKDRLGTSYVFYALAGGMQANGALMDKKYESAMNDSGKSFNISAAKSEKTIDINGVAKEDGYSGVISFKLAEGVKTSLIITAPAMGQPNAENVPDALDFYACDDYWAECQKNKYNVPVTAEESYNHVFLPVLSLTGLKDKWLLSADKSYVYYEVNFTQEFTNNFLAVAFPTRGEESGKFCLYEIAVFDTAVSELPGLRAADVTTVAPETTKAPETTQKPVTTKKPVETKELVTTATPATAAPEVTTEAPKTEEKKGCSSVAAVGVCAIVAVLGTAVLRKKED